MARHVALVRGINVGKHKRIAMAELRTIVEGLGHSAVKTHLNSGDLVFTTQQDRDAATLAGSSKRRSRSKPGSMCR